MAMGDPNRLWFWIRSCANGSWKAWPTHVLFQAGLVRRQLLSTALHAKFKRKPKYEISITIASLILPTSLPAADPRLKPCSLTHRRTSIAAYYPFQPKSIASET
jgi:hypothetical protein